MRSPVRRSVFSQSINPFQAETDARRAVSTVPPMTTSFYHELLRTCLDSNATMMGHTRVSCIGLLLPESGESRFFRACMVLRGKQRGRERTREG